MEVALFDVGLGEAALIVVLGLLIFGAELPKVAAQAGRVLRDLRRMATSARNDLQQGLGPEFSDFDPADLNPRRFVRKHLIEGVDDDDYSHNGRDGHRRRHDDDDDDTEFSTTERPPYDVEAT